MTALPSVAIHQLTPNTKRGCKWLQCNNISFSIFKIFSLRALYFISQGRLID